MQTIMQRYLRMKHRMLQHPNGADEELLVLQGIERRINLLVKKDGRPLMEDLVKPLSVGGAIDAVAPSWLAGAARGIFGYVPDRVQNVVPSAGQPLLDLFDKKKGLLGRLMPPDLLARYRELRGEAPTASPWQAHLPHVQWVPRWVGQVCQKELPFESPNPPPIPIVGTLKQQGGL